MAALAAISICVLHFGGVARIGPQIHERMRFAIAGIRNRDHLLQPGRNSGELGGLKSSSVSAGREPCAAGPGRRPRWRSPEPGCSVYWRCWRWGRSRKSPTACAGWAGQDRRPVGCSKPDLKRRVEPVEAELSWLPLPSFLEMRLAISASPPPPGACFCLASASPAWAGPPWASTPHSQTNNRPHPAPC